ncbi:YceI family protein [Thiopseudomonas denitrificans]|uniref:Polyisoprenoid-binding protein YceI n=1 Tax=Thiopseudomonas denitrificans TaxID=1501432 RepID=A0A4R6TZ85_9GAMM|nr:YceI family protein [Thiopseudomonas denitrificans]TDQ38192.1 polyisoprenoid-binding protein YceI [Thiopseudomonas denitrificans]
MIKQFSLGLLAAALSTSVLADTYKLDPDHTNARFAIGHFGTSTNHGGFYNIEGELQLDAAKGTGQLKIVIPTDSVQTGNTGFDGHLKSADLLNVEKYPTMTFESTAWTFENNQPQSVTGNLTLMGKTNPVTLNADSFNCYESPMFEGATVCGGDFSATIDRTQWGLDLFLGPVPAEVRLEIQVEGIKQ